MPTVFLALHLLTAAAGAALVNRLRHRPRLLGIAAVAAVLMVLAGLALERQPNALLRLWPAGAAHLVFLTNWSLAGAAGLAVVLWHTASDRRRARFLVLALLALAGYSYTGWLRPPPPHLTGTLDADGLCRQSTEDTCTAAAAVMLLHRSGVETTEAEMARLCLSRSGQGTSRLGLFRGLASKGAAAGLTPRVVTPRTALGLCRLGRPAIITVGLSLTAPAEAVRRNARYGWTRGSWHTVLVERGDPDGQWIDVADPSYRRERWPTAGLEQLWDGTAVVLR